MSVLVIVALVLATLPAVLFARNVRLFRKPGSVPLSPGERGTSISVLIPARNEEAGIEACVTAALASTDVAVEVIVLDDASTDRTADIVLSLAATDPRVRLEHAPPLPPGWCGKQHACYTLSKLATHEVITFLDADVRLAPAGLANMVSFLHSSKAALVSGFPQQETGTLLEKLVVPLMNWLLVCYLPFDRMRIDLRPSLGAGCGQWFLTTKSAYQKVGGHAHPLVKESLHDGIKLPRAYRTCGLMTDTSDASADATCRMYRSAGQVWNGFAKNAHEGMGGTITIWVWTLLLAGGHLLPWMALALAWDAPMLEWGGALLACALSLMPRWVCSTRYRQSRLGAVLHPVGVLLMVSIQWYAKVRRWVGRPVGWKGRPHPSQ